MKNNFFAYFADRYLLSITMIFGATIGGMTSEGGGAVAFPVMTLALGIKPSVARDFSLMIQSCGKYIQSNGKHCEFDLKAIIGECVSFKRLIVCQI